MFVITYNYVHERNCFGVLGEANYNTYATNAELPFYITHELCHSIGVMREDDAQLLAFYLLSTSEDPLLRCSAYYNTIGRIIDITSYTDNPNDRKEVIALISDDIRANQTYIYNHWKGRMFLYDFGNAVNDWYLKTFSQHKGTISYDDTPTEVDPEETLAITFNIVAAVYILVGFTFIGCGILSEIAAKITFNTKENGNKKNYITVIVLSAILDSPAAIVGSIFGLITLNREKPEVQQE